MFLWGDKRRESETTYGEFTEITTIGRKRRRTRSSLIFLGGSGGKSIFPIPVRALFPLLLRREVAGNSASEECSPSPVEESRALLRDARWGWGCSFSRNTWGRSEYLSAHSFPVFNYENASRDSWPSAFDLRSIIRPPYWSRFQDIF